MTENHKSRPSVEKVWKKHLPNGATEISIARCTAYDYLKNANKGNLKGIAIQYYGKRITFEGLFESIECYSDSFHSIGVKHDDIVSCISVSVPECIASIYALNKLGATTNTIDPRMDVSSIKRMVTESGSKITLILDVVFEKVAPIIDELNQDLFVILPTTASLPLIKKVILDRKLKLNINYSDRVIGWDEFVRRGSAVHSEPASYVGDRVVAITYTGGTTGFPKGVMITNDSMNAVAENFKNWGLEHSPGQKFLGIIPIFSSYGLVCGMHMPLSMKLELISIPKFNPDEFGKLVRKFKPNHMISTPAFYEMLMNSEDVKNLDLSFLITLGSGGDTMNSGLEKRFDLFLKEHNVRYHIAQGYGMSELSAAATFCANDISKPESVGIPSPTTIVGIFEPETDNELDYGEIGEVCVTGPSMMKGYWNRPDETQNVMKKHSDGRVWVHSGDLGYLDEDGFLFIKGRLKRMITRFDGHKVFPINLENIVSALDGVRNCAVIGVRDRGHGQGCYPMVIVELSDDVHDRDSMCNMIFEYCNIHAEERGRPVAVISVDEVPLTPMGKNDFRLLEEIYGDYDYLTH